MGPRDAGKPRRFTIVKLEERVMPAHLTPRLEILLPPGTANAPGIDVMQEKNH
jgi:hypothetical protein